MHLRGYKKKSNLDLSNYYHRKYNNFYLEQFYPPSPPSPKISGKGKIESMKGSFTCADLYKSGFIVYETVFIPIFK